MYKKALDSIIPDVQEGRFGNLHSLLVSHRQQFIIEAYFNEYNADFLHEAQSVTKSFQSILVGILLDQRYIPHLDIPIHTYLPDYQSLFTIEKQAITLRHLLTMTAGFDWNESHKPYFSLYENHSNQLAMSKDWLYFALSRPLANPPGKVFNYNSASPILISQIIKETTCISNESFAQKYVFEPLDIQDYYYQKSAKDPDLLADIDLTPRDLAKLGLLMLQKGIWQGKQIVSSKWIEASTQSHIVFPSKKEGYGYFWWTKEFKVKKMSIRSYYAWGYGGQHIFVFPSLDVVIVMTGGIYATNLAEEPFELVYELLNVLLSK